MSIASEITRLQGAKAAIKASIEGKGISVPSGATLDMYGGYVDAIATGVAADANGWARPDDWADLPDVTSSSHILAGLVAVYEHGSNYLAVLAEGAYTVDWGDGTVQNFGSGETAQHLYDYATCGGQLCSRGYKTCVVVVTPRAGQNLTSVYLNVRHSGTSRSYVPAWLDVVVAGSSLVSVGIANGVPLRQLERARILKTSTGCTGVNSIFNSCSRLQSVDVSGLTSVTSAAYMFQSCASLRTVDVSAMTAIQTASYMFMGCVALNGLALPNVNYSLSANSMFYDCASLARLDISKIRTAASASGILSGCYSLGAIVVAGWAINLDLSACNLSAPALDSLYAGLTTVSGKTLTITGNPGALTSNTSIATAKGWTVVI